MSRTLININNLKLGDDDDDDDEENFDNSESISDLRFDLVSEETIRSKDENKMISKIISKSIKDEVARKVSKDVNYKEAISKPNIKDEFTDSVSDALSNVDLIVKNNLIPESKKHKFINSLLKLLLSVVENFECESEEENVLLDQVSGLGDSIKRNFNWLICDGLKFTFDRPDDWIFGYFDFIDKKDVKGIKIDSGVILYKIVKSDIKVLLVQNYGNLWSFPKGRNDDDEDFIDCAFRELREETSIKYKDSSKMSAESFLGDCDSIYYETFKSKSKYFIKEFNDSILNIGYPNQLVRNEVTGLGWFGLKEIFLIKHQGKFKGSINKYPFSRRVGRDRRIGWKKSDRGKSFNDLSYKKSLVIEKKTGKIVELNHDQLDDLAKINNLTNTTTRILRDFYGRVRVEDQTLHENIQAKLRFGF